MALIGHLPTVRFVLDQMKEFEVPIQGSLLPGGPVVESSKTIPGSEGVDLVGSPPKYLEKITLEHSIGGLVKFDASFTDPSFDFIEKALVNPLRQYKSGLDRVDIQWGYPSEGRMTRPYRMALESATPIFERYVRWLLKGYTASLVGVYGNNTPVAFKDTTISEAVHQICDVLGIPPDYRVIEPTPAQLPTFTGCSSRQDLWTFMIRELLPLASNVDNVGGYLLYWGPDRGGRTANGALHFHTRDFLLSKEASLQGQDIPTFVYNRGAVNSTVMSFRPTLPSAVFGSMFARGMTILSADGPSKDPAQTAVDPTTETNTPILANESMAPPPVKSEANPANGGFRIWAPYQRDVENAAFGKNMWTWLSQQWIKADMDLAGTPEVLNLVPGGYVRIIVSDPIPGQHSLHWSSGIYLIYKITHEIGTDVGYKVSLELQRDSHLFGLFTTGALRAEEGFSVFA